MCGKGGMHAKGGCACVVKGGACMAKGDMCDEGRVFVTKGGPAW